MALSRLYARPEALHQTLNICALGIIFMAAVWGLLDNQRTTTFEQLLTKESELAASLLEENISLSEHAIKRLVGRWEISGGTREEEFFFNAYSYLNDFPGLQSLEWINADFVVRWIVNSTGEDISPQLNQVLGESQRQELEKIYQQLLPTMSLPRENNQGHNSFLIYFPIKVDGRFDGFIRARYNLQNLVDAVLGDTELFSKLSYVVKIDDEVVYTSANKSDDRLVSKNAETDIELLLHKVSVGVLPNDQLFEANSDYTPEIVLFAGCLMIILIAVALHYYQQSAYVEIQTKAKSEFMAHMSHELRTPLNSIIGFSEMISSQVHGKIGDARYAEYLEDIRTSGYHLLDLVNDILDLTKIEVGKRELFEEDIDLDELLRSTLKMIQGSKEAQKISYRYAAPAHPLRIRADERALRQIVLNLLSNASKYNVEGGDVSVLLRSELDKSMTIVISDTGIGIAPADLSKVIEPFSQARTDAHIAHKGTGLGLALAKLLTELHGGTLTLESELGKGTTVTINLPSNRRINVGAAEGSKFG